MLNPPEYVPHTVERYERREQLSEEFKELATNCIPNNCKVIGCEKCEAREGYHHEHATPTELAASEAAYKTLLHGAQ